MVPDNGPEGARYWAFISYSHADSDFGRRLHRRLEGYSVPRALRLRGAHHRSLPDRLVPIFRDREELPAATDLTAQVREALSSAASLIVVCSPSAARSPWVNREIELFRSLHPDRPILPVILAGEPSECFPPALRQAASPGTEIEPLAADFRRGRDGEQLGLLKLVAGITGVRLDALVQRDAQRRLRRVMAVTAVAALGLVCMTLLAVYAVKQQREAEHQRAEAEGLVEFMLTDLRDKLKGVGRLDILTTVNDRALRYYAGQDIGRLPPQSLERRARLFHAMGEDDETRGNNQSALAEFREAERVTSALLAEAPNDPDRVFDEAQSQYWLGYASYDRGNFAAAKPFFESYRRLAGQLIRLAPADARSFRERGYAEGNLCSLALKRQPKDIDGALESCKAALADMNKAASLSPDSTQIEIDVASRHTWLADVYRARGDVDNERKHRLMQETILNGLIKHDSRNMHLKKLWVALQRILAWMDAEAGHRPMAIDRLRRSMAVSDQMIAFDPNNKVWKQQRRDLDKDLADVKALEPKRSAP